MIIRQNTTWSGALSISERVQIAQGVTLTIAAGSSVTLNGEIENQGSIKIEGTAGEPVVLKGGYITNSGFLSATHTQFGLSIQGGGLISVQKSVFAAASVAYVGGQISGSLFLSSNLVYGYKLLIADSTFIDSPIGSYNWPNVSTSNFFYSGPEGNSTGAIFLWDGAVSAKTLASGNYLYVGQGRTFDSYVRDSDDDINIKVDIKPSDFSTTPGVTALASQTVAGISINFVALASGLATNIQGSARNDLLAGTNSADNVYGLDGDDTFQFRGGNDFFDGGNGLDTVMFSGLRNLSFVRGSGGATVFNAPGTELTIVNVERVIVKTGPWFSGYAFDMGGNAGNLAKTLGAVFGKESIAYKNLVGVGLKFADSGISYKALVELALQERLGPNGTNSDVVNLLYTNVVGKAPSPGDHQYYRDLLDTGVFDRGSLGILAADTDLNANNIGLVGLASTGLEFFYY